MRTFTALAAACALLLLPATAAAVVPPKDCGRIKVDGKRYQVKADQISCKTGRSYARRFLNTGSRPKGYGCRDYASKRGRVDFYCNDGRKIFFAIRR